MLSPGVPEGHTAMVSPYLLDGDVHCLIPPVPAVFVSLPSTPECPKRGAQLGILSRRRRTVTA